MEPITDIEAERRVISSMLHSDTACIYTLSKLDDSDFYNPINRDVYLLAKGLKENNTRPTLVEIYKEAAKTGYITDTKQIEEIKYIVEHYIDSENIKYWVAKVKDAAKARKLQQAMKIYGSKLTKPITDINQLLMQFNDELFNLSMDTAAEVIETPESLASYGIDLINARVDKYRKEQERRRIEGLTGDALILEGTPTGLSELDKHTFGYKPGDLIILGAQTGHGKTAFALNTAKAICLENKKPLLYINTEMSRAQLVYRWGGMLSGIPTHRLRTGSMTNEEKNQVITFYKNFAQSGFLSSYMPNLTTNKVELLGRSAKLQYGIEILILDYVGRMDKYNPKWQEWQMLEQIVKSQKILAQNLDIACMILVQLNEDGSLQGAKRMKNECDLMLKLVPVEPKEIPEIEQKNKKHYEPYNHRIYIDKARDAMSGVSIPIVFEKDTQVIREAQTIGTGWEEHGKEVWDDA